MDYKHLNFGVYEATDNFRAIQQHSCVCFDDLGLVAVTGPADDKEAQEYAELFAAAPDMVKRIAELEKFVYDFLDNFETCLFCINGTNSDTDEICDHCGGTGREIKSRGTLFVDLPQEARRLLGKDEA